MSTHLREPGQPLARCGKEIEVLGRRGGRWTKVFNQADCPECITAVVFPQLEMIRAEAVKVRAEGG